MTTLEALVAEQARAALGRTADGEAAAPLVSAVFQPGTRHLRIAPGPDAGYGTGELAAAVKSLDSVVAVTVARDVVLARLATAFLHEQVVAEALDAGPRYGASAAGAGRRVVLCFSDPNMNKPLHIGHLRNDVLGMSVAALLAHAGYEVDRHAVHSDWGIHIAQAVVGWLRWGEGGDPATAGMRPDAYVGRCYARFHRENGDAGDEDPDARTPLEQEAADLLRSLDEGTADAATQALVRRITDWCETGVAASYRRIGTEIDHVFRERDRLAVARAFIAEAVADGRAKRRDDGSVFVDLSGYDLPDVTLVRRDGSLVVYAQWMGNDLVRYQGRPLDAIVHLAGYEWNPGMIQYAAVKKELGVPWADIWSHIHYGMVHLGEGGKMSSRAGSVVGLEELLDLLAERYGEVLGVALAKHFLLRVPRTHDLSFDVDAVLSKGAEKLAGVVRTLAWLDSIAAVDLDEPRQPARPVPESPALADLLAHVNALGATVHHAAQEYEPAVIVRYAESLADTAGRLLRRGEVSAAVAEVTATALRVALRLACIDLPADLGALPPPFGREPRATARPERANEIR